MESAGEAGIAKKFAIFAEMGAKLCKSGVGIAKRAQNRAIGRLGGG